jgi:hypothetical protein
MPEAIGKGCFCKSKSNPCLIFFLNKKNKRLRVSEGNKDKNAIKNRLGSLNPMGKLKDGKQFSPEFIFMQKRNKAGENNPNFVEK